MNAISVCDGLSAASMACEGLDFKFLLLAEIEPFPRSVLKQRQRAVDQRRYKPRHSAAGRPVLWGDFTAIRPRHVRRLHGHADVDVLFGGTPCQSFSVAGKRAGLDDPRGDLSLEYALLAYRLGVRWFLWENVPGVLSSAKGEDFASILSAFTGRVVEVPRDGWENSGVIPAAGPGQFGIAWRTFDAQYAGVPQRRRRIFLVGYLGDHRRAVAVLFDRESLQGHAAPRREKGQTAPTIPSRSLGGGGLGTDFDCDGSLVAAYGGNNCSGPINVATAVNACNSASGRMDFESETFIAHALRGEGFDASEDGTGRGTPLVPIAIQGAAVRENPSSGPDGVGIRTDGLAYTLEARSEVQVCFRVHGEHSTAMTSNGTANVADPVDTARCLDSAGGYATNQGGNVVLQPIATGTSTVTAAHTTGLGTPRGREQESHENLIAFSCKDYGADVGEVSPTLRSMGHDGSHANAGGQVAVAYGISNQPTPKIGVDVRPSLDSKQSGGGRMEAVAYSVPTANTSSNGWGVQEEVTHTLDQAQGLAVAFNLRGREGGAMPEVSDMVSLRAASGGSPRSYVAGAIATHDVAGTMMSYARSGGDSNRIDNAASGYMAVVPGPTMAVRRLTPTECERLQGFPDDYTAVTHRKKPAADGPRYKALGNSWAVPCARWIVERMQEVDKL